MAAFVGSRSKSVAVAQPLALAFAAFLALLLLVFAGIVFFGRAEDGEPSATLPLNVARQSAAIEAKAPTESLATQIPAAAPIPQNAIRNTVPVYAGRALLADPALIEQTAAGPLPRIADDGRTPMQAYSPAVAATGKPRIAIVISGLGAGAKATSAAIEQTPAAVTLAIIGNAGEPQKWIADARQRGHEVLLQVPMEPYDFPDSDPGPHALRSGAPEDQNLERLTTTLVRATGYAGIANLQGGRFLANSAALSPVLTFAARRGLLFFALPASAASPRQIAEQQKAAYAESVTTLDTDPSPAAIDRQLSELEAQAHAKGAAAASASPYPVTVARIKTWAETLSGRGFVLVPASAIVGQSK
jgi:polysaccharide deacetylase 2 family uncharacterized protein YibQ